jgi:hypothetical protein
MPQTTKVYFVCPWQGGDVSVTFRTEGGTSTVRGVLKSVPEAPLKLRSDANGKEVTIPLHLVQSLRPPPGAGNVSGIGGFGCQVALRDGSCYQLSTARETGKPTGAERAEGYTLVSLPTGNVVVASARLGECAIDFASVESYEVRPWQTTGLTWPQGPMRVSLGKTEVEIRDLASIVAFVQKRPDGDEVAITLDSGERIGGRVTKWPEGAVAMQVGGRRVELGLKEIVSLSLRSVGGVPPGGFGGGHP